MEYLMENLKLFIVLFTVSIFCTVMFSEIVKKLDSKNYLKGYRVYLPLLFSSGFSVALKFIMKIEWMMFPFLEGCLFGFSVFGYEVVLKSINKIIENSHDVILKMINKMIGKVSLKIDDFGDKTEK